MHDLYIAEINGPRLLRFYADSMGLSSFTTIHTAMYDEVVRHGRSRSSKFVPVKRPYTIFYIVIHCNYVPIFYRFRDITIYWNIVQNSAFLCRFYASHV